MIILFAMGLRKWLAEKLYKGAAPPAPPTEEEAEKAEKIKGYELWAKSGKSKWLKIQDLEKPFDFEDFEDPEPGTAYRLSARLESGQYRQQWYRYVEGPKEREVVNPLGALREILAPMKEFGQEMTGLKTDIQEAFGWALPPQQAGAAGVSSLTYKGELPIWMHPDVPKAMMGWTPLLKEMTKDITEGVREGILGIQPKAKPKESPPASFAKPAPSPDEFLEKEEEKPEAS